MARRKQEQYVFDASARTVKVPGHIFENDILSIINTTAGETIYSITDIGKGLASPVSHGHPPLGEDPDFPWSIDGVCTFTLTYDTTSMSDTDDLIIFLEDERKGLTVRPYAAAVDGVERIKTSKGQSLVDADFEYGLQSSKWQNVGFNAGYPSFAEPTGNPLVVTSISSNGASPNSTITVTVASGQSLSENSAFTITGLAEGSSLAEGSFIVSENLSVTQFRYQAKGQISGSNLETPYTTLRESAIFDQAALDVAQYSATNPNQFVTLSFNEPHGLFPGSPFILVDSNGGIQTQEGPYFVSRVINSLSFEYDTPGVVQTSATVTTGLTVYAISNATFTHRPFDGGVLINSYYPIAGLEAKRQTKRYFRYQSGKAINFSTGTLFSPIFDITSASFSGTNITVTTELSHGFQVGVGVALSGIDSVGYNSDNTNYVYTTYTVTGINNENQFTIDLSDPANSGLGAGIVDATATLGIEPKVVAINWKGSAVRAGMFDDANGPYWEYDGDKLYAVLRNSTTQVTGTVTLVNGSNEIVGDAGSGVRFGEQFTAGNKVQIKGQVYEVTDVVSSTVMHVNPAYRGTSSTNSKISLIREIRVPSNQFNEDTVDGHGPSGYYLHIDRMQMVGIQWSWYGAGYVDFQVRGPLGEWITAHRIANANFATEAYMRSGNLPARYEVVTSCRHSKVISPAGTGTSGDFDVKNASKLFPASGGELLLKSEQGLDTIYEIISYTGITGDTITGTTRGDSYTRYLAGQNRTFRGTNVPQNHPLNSSVQFIGNNIAPSVSHWGSSVIMDGEFDEDAGFRFTASRFDITVAAGTAQTVLLFRPAPAVSNTLVGEVGERELINRSRVELQSIEINNVGDPRTVGPSVVVDPRRIEIAGILNASNVDPEAIQAAGNWISANTIEYALGGTSTGYQPSFSQYNITESAAAQGGELLFKFITANETELFDISQVKELQNSILGGNGLYPNGPELVSFVVTNKSTNDTTVDIVLSWKEAQA